MNSKVLNIFSVIVAIVGGIVFIGEIIAELSSRYSDGTYAMIGFIVLGSTLLLVLVIRTFGAILKNQETMVEQLKQLTNRNDKQEVTTEKKEDISKLASGNDSYRPEL